MTVTNISRPRTISIALRHFVLNWERYREALAKELGIGTTELIALGHLYELGAMTPTELGRNVMLSSGSITALIDRLTRAGFVTRQQNPDDRRSLIVAANPAGRHAVEWVYDQLDAAIGDVLARFPDLDRSRLLDAIDGLADTLENLAVKPGG